MILKLAEIFLVCIILKVCYNAYYYFLAKKFLGKYNQYVKNIAEDKTDWTIQENKHKIISIFKNAGLKDFTLSSTELAGFGFIKTTSYSFFDNIPLVNVQIALLVRQFFIESMGVFKNRTNDSINPVYWLEALIFLPRKIFSYLGVGADSLIIKAFQVLWWLVGAAGIIIGIIFNSEFRMWLSINFKGL
jgi:hypothetical protein